MTVNYRLLHFLKISSCKQCGGGRNGSVGEVSVVEVDGGRANFEQHLENVPQHSEFLHYCHYLIES